jgi:hypothetical protein
VHSKQESVKTCQSCFMQLNAEMKSVSELDYSVVIIGSLSRIVIILYRMLVQERIESGAGAELGAAAKKAERSEFVQLGLERCCSTVSLSVSDTHCFCLFRMDDQVDDQLNGWVQLLFRHGSCTKQTFPNRTR